MRTSTTLNIMTIGITPHDTQNTYTQHSGIQYNCTDPNTGIQLNDTHNVTQYNTAPLQKTWRSELRQNLFCKALQFSPLC